MTRHFFFGLLMASLSGSVALAQTISGGDSPVPRATLAEALASPDSSEGAKKPDTQSPQGPTTIDSANMDYDEKTRIAIFTGENYGVFLKDPQFTVNCDKLTAYMRKAGARAPAPAGKPSPSPQAARSKESTAAAKTNGLQRAIAESGPDHPVVIIQDKPAANGEQAQHNVGIAEKADYDADTGDVILTGWPRISQGINTQIALSKDTVMTMNKDGHTMTTKGRSRTIIQEQDQSKKPTASSPSPDQSTSPQ